MKVRITSSIQLALTLLVVNRLEAFSSISSTTTSNVDNAQSTSPFVTQYHRRNTFLMYGPNSDNNDPKKEAKDALNSGFWNALEYTEQWISSTLEANSGGNSNPHARKELNYHCEMNEYALAAVASIFRRFREAREMGERHSLAEEQMARRDPSHERTVLRETQVVIVPFCDFFDSFKSFEGVMQAINQSRKDSKDFITDVSIEKMEAMETEWNLSINGASLHPRYGEKTPKEIIKELEQFEEDGEIDLNKMEKSKRRNQARRSPYPTLIIELQAAPPQPIDGKHDSSFSLTDDEDDLKKRGVLKDVVKKLESIFAKSAVLHKKTEIKKVKNDDNFYNAIGRTSGVEEILASSPISATQQWVIDNDPFYKKNVSSFASADVEHADAAFEFVFSNLAMNRYIPSQSTVERKEFQVSSRSYLIMPKFVTASATSLEKFMSDVRTIIDSIDGLNERVSLSLMHPEHVRREKRSPAPVLIIQWYNETK